MMLLLPVGLLLASFGPRLWRCLRLPVFWASFRELKKTLIAADWRTSNSGEKMVSPGLPGGKPFRKANKPCSTLLHSHTCGQDTGDRLGSPTISGRIIL
uniref:Putative secreted protein n=1 Tax=Anopheles marajoara TaxID=58244 RepID=A0A2M4C8Y2_9DIPT